MFEMIIVAAVSVIGTALICLFITSASKLNHEEEAYQEGYRTGYGDKTIARTKGDEIRAYTDEELAERILKLDLGEAPYCSFNNAECTEMAEKGELVPPEMCKQCCVRWLQQEIKEL